MDTAFAEPRFLHVAEAFDIQHLNDTYVQAGTTNQARPGLVQNTPI